MTTTRSQNAGRFSFRSVIAVGALALLGVMAPARAAEVEHTSMAQTPAIMAFLSAYIAEDAAIWRDNGLDVKVINLPGVATVNAVIAGSADFALSGSDALTRAAAKGQKLLALAAINNQSGQVTSLRKELAEAAHFDPNAPLATRVRALKGHTIADGGPGSVADLFMKTIMRIGGLAPSDVTLSSIGAFELIAAFQRHAIDGMSFSVPYSLEVAHSGDAVIIADGTKNEPKEFMPLAAGLLLTRPQLCTEHRSICEKMTHSMLLAVKFLLSRKDDSIAILQKRFPKTDPAVVRASYEAVSRMTNDPPAITTQALKNGDLMNEQAGFMKIEDALPSYDGLFTNEFLK
ncbi:MAG TPA: ABC transporter substrate-binding protein [Stellaceae bacterium]|nr:ABC transporter substrate-binding protein [Stellaceae bacterium]